MDPISRYNYLSKDINYTFLSEKKLRSNLNKSLRTDQRKVIFLLKIGPLKYRYMVSTDFSENGIFVDDTQSDA